MRKKGPAVPLPLGCGSVSDRKHVNPILSRARKQAFMSLRDIGGDENLPEVFWLWYGADEVETALEQLSPTASLIRNARLNR
jgi:hypothetical protein